MAYEQYGFNDNKTKYDLSSIKEIQNQIANLQTTILNRVYPVGCVYFTTSKTNPSNKDVLGFGTWSRLSSEQRFLVISDPTNSSMGATQTGGSNFVTLTAENIPDHAHRIDTTTEDENVFTIKRPWGNVRVIPIGTGDTAGITPSHLGFSFSVRRVKTTDAGTAMTTVNPSKNGRMSVQRKDQNEDIFGQSIVSTAQESQYPDTITADLTKYTKIEGFTGDGIYTKNVYDHTTIQEDRKYKWTDLAQKSFDNRPAYITLYAWRRTG